MSLVVWILIAVLSGLAVYTYMYPYTQPEAKIVEIEKPIVVEKEVIRTVEVIKTVEVIVEATPQPTQEPVAVLSPVIPTATQKTCLDQAWIEMQPRDAVQGDAVRSGSLYRLNVSILNMGNCDWIGYKLVSVEGDVLEVDVPVTYPGQTATWLAEENIARFPVQYKFMLKDNFGNTFPFLNGSLQDGTMNWQMEVYTRLSLINPGSGNYTGYNELVCGVSG
jgi:hypothetical protein